MTVTTTAPFRSAFGTGSHWADIARSCLDRIGKGGPDDLGFVYVTDHLAPDLPAIVDQLRLRSGIENWVGTIGIGLLGRNVTGDLTELFDAPAISLMVAPLPPDSYRLLDPNPGGGSSRMRALADWMAARQPAAAIVHGNPENAHLPAIMRQLSHDAGLFLLGGLTASRRGYLQVAGEVGTAAISGVLLAGDIRLVTGLSQGCSPIGPVHVATRVENDIVMELDGRPALEVFCDEIGEVLSRDLQKVAGFIFAALPVTGSDTGDYLVRNITGIDRNSQALAIGAEIAEGQQILFTRRDRASATADFKRMLRRLKERVDRPIKGGLYVSCVARGPHLFGTDAEETRMIAEHLGDFPLTGFFANGEISHDRVYAYTGVLTLFL